MRELKVSHFNLRDSLECGQTFCWSKSGEGYINTDAGQVIYVEQRGDALLYETSASDIDVGRMLGLQDPLEEIQQEVCKDEFMRRAIEFAPGLRIVRDPIFPCLVSFLCSIRNSIPNIRTAVQRIRRAFGPSYLFRGVTYYGMPSPERLSEARPEELKRLGLEWRADFIVATATAVARDEVNLSGLQSLPYEEAHRELKSLYGVGDKVADCVCLFSLEHLEAFPIDVWIERVIEQQYNIFTTSGKSYAKKSLAARRYFGRYAGYAQEYLYYYSRSTS